MRSLNPHVRYPSIRYSLLRKRDQIGSYLVQKRACAECPLGQAYLLVCHEWMEVLEASKKKKDDHDV